MVVLKFPNPLLFVPCEEVTVFDSKLKDLLDSMWDTMLKEGGMGLSANQVGLNYKMFTMIGPEGEKLFIVNPKILVESEVKANLKEGCLSAPGEYLILLERANIVQVLYQNELGEPRTQTFIGIHAVCVQHELEHLTGKSYLQSKSLSRQIRRQMQRKWNLK